MKYGPLSASSLGEKVLSPNHGDPSMQTAGAEQASSKSNSVEGKELELSSSDWLVAWVETPPPASGILSWFLLTPADSASLNHAESRSCILSFQKTFGGR